MKRSSALKNIKKMVDKVRMVNGILSTPLHDSHFVKVKRMWLFGSVAKGSDEPNDIDIFVELAGEVNSINLPRVYRGKYAHFLKHKRRYGGLKLDKQSAQWKNLRVAAPPRSSETFIKWLRKDMRKISIHVVGHDEIFEKLDTKVMLYPRCDFDASPALD